MVVGMTHNFVLVAPYGSDETPGLQSIFEAVKGRPCIADKKVLLNITCQ
jgi:hypothetical protein